MLLYFLKMNGCVCCACEYFKDDVEWMVMFLTDLCYDVDIDVMIDCLVTWRWLICDVSLTLSWFDVVRHMTLRWQTRVVTLTEMWRDVDSHLTWCWQTRWYWHTCGETWHWHTCGVTLTLTEIWRHAHHHSALFDRHFLPTETWRDADRHVTSWLW